MCTRRWYQVVTLAEKHLIMPRLPGRGVTETSIPGSCGVVGLGRGLGVLENPKVVLNGRQRSSVQGSGARGRAAPRTRTRSVTQYRCPICHPCPVCRPPLLEPSASPFSPSCGFLFTRPRLSHRIAIVRADAVTACAAEATIRPFCTIGASRPFGRRGDACRRRNVAWLLRRTRAPARPRHRPRERRTLPPPQGRAHRAAPSCAGP